MKKSFIRAIALALVVLTAIVCLAACSTKPEGKYVLKTIDGQTPEEAVKKVAEALGISAEDFLKQAGIDKFEEIYTIELLADGKAKIVAGMFDSTIEGTWKQDGDKIIITADDQPATFTLKGKELETVDGEQKYVFVKK
ncbi:MAG: hypothetical protein IJQ53_07685 [Clostridia bacterium]|nr:hypothetical protein [Clostridia bacterium]